VASPRRRPVVARRASRSELERASVRHRRTPHRRPEPHRRHVPLPRARSARAGVVHQRRQAGCECLLAVPRQHTGEPAYEQLLDSVVFVSEPG
jgi:hypothetical protein